MTQKRLCVIAAAVSLGATAARIPSQNEPVAAAAAPKNSIQEILLPVPGGELVIGRTADQLLESLAILNPFNKEGRVEDGRKMMSELGPKPVQVEAFLLGKSLVTNAQYKVFVEKTGHRFPYDWWRFGETENYETHLTKIKEQFGSDDDGPYNYWAANWETLPWKIPSTEKRANEPSVQMLDFPVVYVSWRDAVAFAAWAGMRLPTEAEWIFATVGSEYKEFLWGDNPEAPIPRGNRDRRPVPVGAHGDLTAGPFGHLDMVLNVSQWTGDIGFFPFDHQEFSEEREDFLKDKLWRTLEKKDTVRPRVEALKSYQPNWRGDRRVVKGGHWNSGPDQWRVAVRPPLGDIAFVESVGFRLAKSAVPGRDLALSRIRLGYDYSFFGEGREPDLSNQVGIEAYDIREGMIHGYDAVSIVPINFVGVRSLSDLERDTIESPVPIATFVATQALSVPEVPIGGGIYTVMYRNGGTPKDLESAWKDARRDLAKAKKNAEGKFELEGEVKWRGVLMKYGLAPEDVGDHKTPPFVRMRPGDLEVPMDVARYLLRDQQGNYVQHWPATVAPILRSLRENAAASIELTKKPKSENSMARFEFGSLTEDKSRSVFRFTVDIELAWTH